MNEIELYEWLKGFPYPIQKTWCNKCKKRLRWWQKKDSISNPTYFDERGIGRYYVPTWYHYRCVWSH